MHITFHTFFKKIKNTNKIEVLAVVFAIYWSKLNEHCQCKQLIILCLIVDNSCTCSSWIVIYIYIYILFGRNYPQKTTAMSLWLTWLKARNRSGTVPSMWTKIWGPHRAAGAQARSETVNQQKWWIVSSRHNDFCIYFFF